MRRTAIALICLASTGALAEDLRLKRILQESRCIPRDVREIVGLDGHVTYEVACRAARPRLVYVVCAPRLCALAGGSGSPDDREDDR